MRGWVAIVARASIVEIVMERGRKTVCMEIEKAGPRVCGSVLPLRDAESFRVSQLCRRAYCTVRVTMFDAGDPGFWQVMLMVPAVAMSAAPTAIVRCCASTKVVV